MELEIRTQERDGVSIVILRGRLVLGEASKELRESLNRLLSQGKRQLVLNLENVTYIDSSGIGTLVAAYSTVRRQGGSLKLSHLGARFRETLQLTRLLTVFEVFPDDKAAVLSFAWYNCEKHGNYPGPPPCPRCPK